MIDKNDVKMPIQKEGNKELDKEQARKIKELLDKVNEVENKQELRLKSDYYGRFNWFGYNVNQRERSSYFSYQEEAVYDFVFTLNKSGILSDQVGMGKTIEAGMIISELAGRNELRSLLIVVPNEIMAKKWEFELKEKFGIRRRKIDGTNEFYPDVRSLRNFDDFCISVYKCSATELFNDLPTAMARKEFTHDENEFSDKDTIGDVIKRFILADIKKAVNMVNEGFDLNEIEGNPRIDFDGKSFTIAGKNFSRAYEYGANDDISAYIKRNARRENVKAMIHNPHFVDTYHNLLESELTSLYTFIGHYITTIPTEITKVTTNLKSGKNCPILVIPISYTEQCNGKTVQTEFLNRPLLNEIKNYQHAYVKQGKDGTIEEKYENYRIIDFFIDVGYQTLIVDEVHDYINVCAKVERKNFHREKLFTRYPSNEYNRYELFDDYYFISQNSLYKKLKHLADRANRKIFLTATPIKSDMIDFYLLTLLASNKDSEAYKKARDALTREFPTEDEREDAVNGLYQAFKDCIENADDSVIDEFCGNESAYFKRENEDDDQGTREGRLTHFVYPYFNNGFLFDNAHDPKAIKDYLLSQMSYLSTEEIVLELILSYNAENAERSAERGTGIRDTINEIINLLGDRSRPMQTRVVFRSLLNNTVKLRFEEDFTKYDEDGSNATPIKRIRELLELEEGPRRWHKTYRKYGIRHTRHQTYNLAKCDLLGNFSESKRERYKNLPIWPKRDGKVILLLRDDVFFDCFLDIKRDLSDFICDDDEITMEELPNYDKLKGSDDEKQSKFDNAVAIFDYINDAMSGGDEEFHEPQNSKYESVELDDSGMVDYKLALVNKLMLGNTSLGSVTNKVLLFAENDRDAIVEWFRYQKCAPIYNEQQPLDNGKAEDYEKRWQRYTVEPINDNWRVSESAEDINIDGNVLIIIDPKRYEKGVDLQKADTIINFDINYCPLKMEQRIGRIDRIRPSNTTSKINIISFVPLNDMSGYVVNFFANELKMFTQWMGETTGIVSVPEEANATKGGEDVSFEGKVYKIENFYKYIYELCRNDISNEKISEMANEFKKFFAAENVDAFEAEIDFGFINKLRGNFDKAYRNSVSPEGKGYAVKEKAKSRVIRFNSTMGVFENTCEASSCAGCGNKQYCNEKNKSKHNVYNDYQSAVREFFTIGTKYYEQKEREVRDVLRERQITENTAKGGDSLLDELLKRKSEFAKAKDNAFEFLDKQKDSQSSFTIDFDAFSKAVAQPMKKQYWDNVVNKYIKLILNRFYKQCDSVLQSAKLFERFIKTLSIADFMNNMEGK